MNETFGANPAEVRPAVQLPVVPDTLEDIDAFPNDDESRLKPRREGLPPTFSMRHDKHYVEELMSTPTITPVPAPVTTVPELAPTAIGAAPSGPSAAAVELIAGRLEAVVTHGAVRRGSGPSDLVGRAVETELQRVSRFARAVAVSVRRTEATRRPVMAGDIAGAIRSACVRLARLNAVECLVATDDPGFSIAVERSLVVQSIVGTVDALLDLVDVRANDDGLDDRAAITVSMQTTRVRPALIVDIACQFLKWQGGSAERFFENDEHDYAAAPSAGILLAAAAHGVRLHGGRAEMRAHDGVSIRYVIPGQAQRPTAAS